MKKKLFLLAVVGCMSLLPAHAYKWYYGVSEFDPTENRSGNAYTVATMGGYEINFSLLCYHTGSILDAWASEITLYAAPATAKQESEYVPILVITSMYGDEEKQLRAESKSFRMNLTACDSSGVFMAPDGTGVKTPGKQDSESTNILTFPHQEGDEGAYMDLKWIPAQRWVGRQVRFMVRVRAHNTWQEQTGGDVYTHYLKGMFSTSSVTLEAAGIPVLLEPTLCNLPGKLRLHYVAADSVVRYSIRRFNTDVRMKGVELPVVELEATKDKPIALSESLDMDADDYSYEVKATFTLQRGKGIEDVVSAVPEGLIFPAYHSIHYFKVEPYIPTEGTYKGIYRGHKKLTWEIHHVDHRDVSEDDMFEIQRSSDPNFTNAELVMMIPYNSPDFSRREPEWQVGVDKFPCQLYSYIDSMPEALNSDSVKSPMYYRIRRVTSSVWNSGWIKEYSSIQRVHAPVYLAMPYVKDDTPIFSMGADYTTNRTVHIRVPFTPNVCEGNYFAWDDNAQVVLIRYWSDLPTPENPQPAEQHLEIYVPKGHVVFDRGGWYFTYTDHPSIPCVNYRYAIRVESAGAQLPLITYETVAQTPVAK